MQAFSFFVGIVFGAFIGLMLFSFLVPSGDQMIALYHHKIAEVESMKNDAKMKMITDTDARISPENHAASMPAMAPITSERQFLKEMVAHHEAAILMSKQVLALPGNHGEVTSLAKNIISSQTTEIKMMKDWIAAWKY